MKKITLLLSAMLFSVMSFASLGEGYTKVTDITTLAAGDKVVLYCDDAALGVTGYNGNKDATVASTGWVEYVVEAANGGVLLKDGNQYISLTVKNSFKYAATGSVCKVTAAGVLTCTLSGADYLLYQNNGEGGPFYRMYVDKSTDSRYKPFYVYKVGEGSGNTPGGETPETEVTVSDLNYADAIYYEYDGIAYYDFDLYNDSDPETYEYVYPELYFSVEAKSKTAINGTYSMIWAGLWTSTNDSVLTDEESPVGSVTIKNVDNEGNYSFKGSFVGTDGKTYTFDKVLPVWAFDFDTFEEVTLNENGTDNPGTDNPGTDNPGTSNGATTFDADVDMGNATTDYNLAAAFKVSKNGVTLDVTKGCIGTYNNENHYRIYKNETLTITSTVGNIVSVEFTCTANDDEKYGPGCFTVADGSYSYSGAVGTWTGSANEVVFTASLNQVRASQIVVKVATATGVEDVTTVVIPVKVMQDGQILIKRGENIYNAAGVQVK
ncbi:MAG: hypothetical protein IKV31_07070 [Paludibacteraceae bacterium]|nr:hypothetical protein [Paludibacteraceae bacterium]